MMDTVWFLGKLLLLALPIIAAGLLPLLINLKKQKRHLQLCLPLIALVYGIVFLVFIDDISGFLLSGVYALLDRFGDVIEKSRYLRFINDINWAYGIIYIANAAMLLLFLLIKVLLLPILAFRHPEKRNGIVKKLTSLFYVYDEADEKWYVKDKFAHSKKVMKYVHIGFILFSAILFAVTYHFVSKTLLSVPFYPMFGILLFGECLFFLSGLPKKGEKSIRLDGPEDEPLDEVDFDELKELYSKVFEDRLANTTDSPAIKENRTTVDELLEHYCEEGDIRGSHDAKLFYKYFSQLRDSGVMLDDGFITAARNIINGKSVLFNTPFYEDTTHYVFLPLLRNLMRNNNVLIIVGRVGAEANVKKWLSEGVFKVNSFENLWKTDYIADADDQTKIAILPMKDIYNQKIISSKANFFERATMVIIMDPTRLLGTMQVGLSNIVTHLQKGGTPQYLAFDRNCDGLVDSLSHVIGNSIEEVTATVVGGAKSISMVWEADGMNLHHRLGLDTSRYLGVGTELAALAISKKVPIVNWLAYEKFPAADIRWIVSQYYVPLCKVMKLPVNQFALENKLDISDDLWSMPKAEERVVVVEDEYNNPYEVIRQFSTRASERSFIHVISQNYLLRDYMCENSEIFTYDPKAIPSLVADYQRVRINTVCRIAMRLINGRIYEDEIRSALELIGVYGDDVHKYLSDLINETFLVDKANDNLTAEGVINVDYELVVDPKTHRPERKRVYSITNTSFVDKFLSQLRVVYYIAENEKNKGLYLNSILYGHIYQKYLPGVFAVFDGKYYEVVSVTRNAEMIVRRAADHITKRRYYRQLRTYTVNGFKPSDGVESVTSKGNVRFERGEARINVSTEGFLEMADYGNIKDAKKVSLNGIPERAYPHKSIMRFRLEGADDKVRFTVATMINELFVTMFPEMHEYVVATTRSLGEDTKSYVPELITDTPDDDYVYIIEDSLIDLGLLINVDRYFGRIIEIVTDLLCWHYDKIAPEDNGENGGELPPSVGGVDDSDGAEDDPEGEKKKGWWRRFVEWLKRLFRRKKKDEPVSDNPGAASPENEGEIPEIAPPEDAGEAPGTVQPESEGAASADGDSEEQKAEELVEGSNGDEATPEQETPVGNRISFNIFGKDVVDENEGDITGEDEESVDVENGEAGFGGSDKRKPYEKRYYMLYGYNEVPKVFDLDATWKYLKENGFADNYLKQTRDSLSGAKSKWYNHRFEPGEHYCDFCGAKIEDTFSVLKDGRERCKDCTNTAITKVRHFRKLYKQTHRRMEEVYGIKIKSKISIRITNAEEIAAEVGETFKPTNGFDGRTLGFAQRMSNGKTRLVLENGAPKVETEKTLVHELTHIWQYENMDCLWNPKDLVAIEGMAVWSEAQYLVCNGMKERADDYVKWRSLESSEYGKGMREYIKKYPLRDGKTAKRNTPFSKPGRNPLH